MGWLLLPAASRSIRSHGGVEGGRGSRRQGAVERKDEGLGVVVEGPQGDGHGGVDGGGGVLKFSGALLPGNITRPAVSSRRFE